MNWMTGAFDSFWYLMIVLSTGVLTAFLVKREIPSLLLIS